MFSRSLCLAAALLSAVAVPAAAADLVNGSFELGSDPGSGADHLGDGATAVAGWTVGGAGVDYVGGYWQAADGTRSVGLSGTGSSSIWQTIATEAGASYLILFDMSGDPDGGIARKQLVVSVDGAQQLVQSYDVTASNSRSDMYWQTYYLEFTVLSNLSTLSFASFGSDGHGPALDNIQLFGFDSIPSGVPEPLTWALMGVGFAVVGAARRRAAPSPGHAVGNT